MSKNLNYKQVANVTRRQWDVEAYEKKAQARQTEEAAPSETRVSEHAKEEFRPAEPARAGPEGSNRAYLKARQNKVDDIDSRVGSTELLSVEAAAATSSKEGVVQTGVGWHCKVCDCFLRDSHAYLDHINGRKHQRKLGFSMRVERSSKDQVMEKLKQLTKRKENELSDVEVNYEELVKRKDEEEQRRREERKRKRQERKLKAREQQPHDDDEDGDVEGEEEKQDDTNEEETEEIDPQLAAMMGFSGFGGGNKN